MPPAQLNILYIWGQCFCFLFITNHFGNLRFFCLYNFFQVWTNWKLKSCLEFEVELISWNLFWNLFTAGEDQIQGRSLHWKLKPPTCPNVPTLCWYCCGYSIDVMETIIVLTCPKVPRSYFTSIYLITFYFHIFNLCCFI